MDELAQYEAAVAEVLTRAEALNTLETQIATFEDYAKHLIKMKEEYQVLTREFQKRLERLDLWSAGNGGSHQRMRWFVKEALKQLRGDNAGGDRNRCSVHGQAKPCHTCART